MATAVQKSSVLIIAPIQYSNRNVFTKIDDIGLYGDLRRHEGESISNFRARLYTLYTRPGSANKIGLTDSIAREFGLGHDILLSVTADRPIKLDIYGGKLYLEGSGINTQIDLITLDQNGYWDFPVISGIVNQINTITGLVATNSTNYDLIPSFLLEDQSSYVNVFNETTPPLNEFNLGSYDRNELINGTVLSGSLSFADQSNFITQVSGVPNGPGEWKITNNTVSVYNLPEFFGRVTYTYNILESGMTFNIIGNGIKVINLFEDDFQRLILTGSGIGATGYNILSELYSVDRSTWGI